MQSPQLIIMIDQSKVVIFVFGIILEIIVICAYLEVFTSFHIM
jgi:hypothetical protein